MKPLTDEAKVKITIDCFEPLTRGLPRKKTKALAADWKHSPNTIDAAIKYVFEHGLVRLIETDFQKANRAAHYEAELNQLYDHRITNLIVVDAAESSSEEIHKILGHSCATRLEELLMFRYGQSVCLGSGRGSYYTIAGYKNVKRDRSVNLTFYSVSGDLHGGSEQNDAFKDADYNVAVSTVFFDRDGDKITPKAVYKPLVHEGQPPLTVLSHEHAGYSPFNHAVLGVGILNHEHRLYRAVTGIRKLLEEKIPLADACERESIPVEIYPQLDRLIELCDKIREDQKSLTYYPCGDVTNRLLYIEPRGISFSNEQVAILEDIQRLIDETNQHLLTLTDEALRQIGEVHLVCGTESKAGVVKQLLDGVVRMDGSLLQPNIQSLCVDVALAKKLLSLSRQDVETGEAIGRRTN